MKAITRCMALVLLLVSQGSYSDENKEEGHGHGHGHEKQRGNVGPNKGVLEADEHSGFRLNSTVEGNFAIKKTVVKGSGPFLLPVQAIVWSGLETQVFRYRDGYWKAEDVEVVRKDRDKVTIRCQELRSGDSVAVAGVGFLKIVEQSIFGPAVEGHVH